MAQWVPRAVVAEAGGSPRMLDLLCAPTSCSSWEHCGPDYDREAKENDLVVYLMEPEAQGPFVKDVLSPFRRTLIVER